MGNVYFAISPGNFTTQFVPANVTLIPGGAIGIVDVAGNCNRNGFVDPGEKGVTLTIPVSNAGSVVGTSMVGTLTSSTPGVDVIQSTAAYGDLPFGGLSSNASPFSIKVSESHPCVVPLCCGSRWHTPRARRRWISACRRRSCRNRSRSTIPARGRASRTPVLGELTIPVAGVTGPVHDVTFAVAGSACTDWPGSATRWAWCIPRSINSRFPCEIPRARACSCGIATAETFPLCHPTRHAATTSATPCSATRQQRLSRRSSQRTAPTPARGGRSRPSQRSRVRRPMATGLRGLKISWRARAAACCVPRHAPYARVRDASQLHQ